MHELISLLDWGFESVNALVRDEWKFTKINDNRAFYGNGQALL